MKIRVAVLFGGKSVEHEVSVISALQAIENLNKDKYDIIPVYITKNNEFYTGLECSMIEEYSDIPALLKKTTRCVFMNVDGSVKLYRFPFKKFGKNVISDIDVAFPVVHGTNVEDGTLQGYLKTLGVPFVGCDVTSSALGMDKYSMKTVLKDNGVPVLDCLRFYSNIYEDTPDEVVNACCEKFSFPVIVKPANLGSSVGISIAHNKDELNESLSDAFRYANTVLVEKAITNLTEINCAVLGDMYEAEASELEQPIRSGEILDFEKKYLGGGGGAKGAKTDGAKSAPAKGFGAKTGGTKGSGEQGMASLSRIIPAPLTPERREEIRTLAVKAFKALGCCGVSRIDFMIDGDADKVYLNEINTIPGSLAFYLWKPLGLEYSKQLDRMIDLAFKRKREEDSIVFSFESNILEKAASAKGASCSKGGKLGGSKA